MLESIAHYAGEIVSFILGAVCGIAGSLVTIRIVQKKNQEINNGSLVDQSGAKAGRDMAGGNFNKK